MGQEGGGMQITLWHTACSPGLLQRTVHDSRIRYPGGEFGVDTAWRGIYPIQGVQGQ